MSKLIKAAERVLALSEGQHSLRDQIDAYEALAAAVAAAKAPRKPSATAPPKATAKKKA